MRKPAIVLLVAATALLAILLAGCSDEATPTPTPTPTDTPSSAPTSTATAAPIDTPTPTPTATLIHTATPMPEQSGSDRAVLVALYHSTGGANWHSNWNLLSDRPIGEWNGVTTDNNGRVIELNLYRNGLTGEIPPELGGLSNLTWLNLSSNGLTGEIPPELGGLSNLTKLYLYGNDLTGEIPPELGGLSNLTKLYLSSNRLTGEIPPELGGLSNLTWLSLRGNGLTGEIPPELGGVSNLIVLYLGSNQLTGEIPPELGGLSNLTGLFLYFNQLTGEIPPELGGLSNLTGLGLSSNRLTGCIPEGLRDVRENDFASLNLPDCDAATPRPTTTPASSQAVTAEITHCSILHITTSGPITERWSQVSISGTVYAHEDVSMLVVTARTSEGQIGREEFATLGAGESRDFYFYSGPYGHVALGSCTVSLDYWVIGTAGPLIPDSCSNGIAVPNPHKYPSVVSDCEALLDAKDTLRGTATLNWSASASISQWDGITVGGMPRRVIRLQLSRNQLTGEIPPELGGLSNLTWLDLGDNQLKGEIPPELGGLSNLTGLHLSGNGLTGGIPPELGGLSNLTGLSLNNNQLTGEIPPELGGLSNLTDLGLNDNGLTGEIPPELGDLSNLTWLYLSGNRLTGEIPPELGGLSNLESLWLHENRLTGEIPPELGGLSNLTGLYLSGNGLTGEIPPELGGLSNLTWLSLGDNQLTGCIPEGLRNIPENDLASVNLPDCTTATPTQSALDRAVLVALYHSTGGASWDANTNWLSDRPIGEWHGVTTDSNGRVIELSLRGNGLTGEIPPELGDLSNLTDLGLNDNGLTGEIPPELGGLPNLRCLLLYGNQLTGEIPELQGAAVTYDLRVEPAAPVVGEQVTVVAILSADGGLAEYCLSGELDPVLELKSERCVSYISFGGAVSWDLLATGPGTATLTGQVYYETSFPTSDCGYYWGYTSDSSPPFTIDVGLGQSP